MNQILPRRAWPPDVAAEGVLFQRFLLFHVTTLLMYLASVTYEALSVQPSHGFSCFALRRAVAIIVILFGFHTDMMRSMILIYGYAIFLLCTRPTGWPGWSVESVLDVYDFFAVACTIVFALRMREHAKNILNCLRVELVFDHLTAPASPGGNCAICQTHDDVLCRTPCGHEYHRECLRKWLQSSWRCPLCRRNLPSEKTSEGVLRKVWLLMLSIILITCAFCTAFGTFCYQESRTITRTKTTKRPVAGNITGVLF